MGLVLDIMFAWSNEFKPPRGSRGVGSPAILEAVEAVGPPRGCRGAGSPVACGRGLSFSLIAIASPRPQFSPRFVCVEPAPGTLEPLSDGQAVGDKKNSVEPAPGTLEPLSDDGAVGDKKNIASVALACSVSASAQAVPTVEKTPLPVRCSS